MNVLFVCNQNENRSRTAETIFKGKFNSRSAGLYNANPVNEEQIAWADVIMVMEGSQRSELARRFPKQYMAKCILSLDIPDMYRYNQPELISVLKSKVEEAILAIH